MISDSEDISDDKTSQCNGFRIKKVSEINGSASSSTEATTAKRKLPAWMMTQVLTQKEDSAASVSKRSKITEEATAEAMPGNLNGTEAEVSAESASGSNPEQNEEAEPSSSRSDQFLNEDETAAEAAEAEVSDTPTASLGVASGSVPNAAAEIKTEEEEDEPAPSSSAGVSNPVDIKPAVRVEKADASSTSRESCKFGIRCYRRNPMHRIEEAHPGDHDYKRPNFPLPPLGTPDCPFGDSCYRRNPVHFQQFSHPPDTDFEQNYKNHRMRLRQRLQRPNNSNDASGNSSDLDDYDLEDPFIDDGSDDDYVPDDDEEEADYDDCDKAEE